MLQNSLSLLQGIMRLWLSVLGRIAKRLGHGCSLTDLIGADNTAAAEDLLNTVRPRGHDLGKFGFSPFAVTLRSHIAVIPREFCLVRAPRLHHACTISTYLHISPQFMKIPCFMLISGLRWPLPSGADELQSETEQL